MSFTVWKSMQMISLPTKPVLRRVTALLPRFAETQYACNSTSSESSDRHKDAEHAKYFPSKSDVMLPAGTFSNKTAFITGGGTGLGRGMATVLSHLGATVVISSRKQDVLDKTAAEITKTTGNPVYPVAADVRDPTSVKAAFDICEEKCGLPHIVINNAAGNFIAPTERLSANAWRSIVGIVLDGTAHITLEVGKRLIKAEQGAAFLAITTPYAQSGSGFVVPSAAAKAGVEAITKSLSAEWARYGMRFNCIAPGPIYTKGAFNRLSPEGFADFDIIGRIPVGRIGQVPELANLAAYLVSDYASWINGQVITLDGGEEVSSSSMFNQLLKISNDQWDMIETMIKSVKGS